MMKKTIISRIKQTLKKRFKPVSLILMYHRIADVKSDPWRLCVTPQHFAEHLEVLQKLSCSLRLDQLARALLHGKIAERSVVVTFDDGYLDNLYTAKPLLEQFGIPATFFLSTGCIDQQREFWWDELERLILQPLLLPESLQLTIRGEKYERDLNGDAQYNEKKVLNNGFRREREEASGVRRELYYSLWQLLKPLENREREHVLDELQKWAGAEPHMRSTHRLLRLEEIRALFKGSLFDVGAHSVSHASLPSHTLSFQMAEINGSKRYLENLLCAPVTSFSYPYGDYAAETIGLVKDVGFSCACSTRAAGVFSNTDRFQLPRLEVPDCDGEEFENRLLKWFAKEHV